ncbi:unnamed protein product, partial [Rangifer tarandus platyrhynchus]
QLTAPTPASSSSSCSPTTTGTPAFQPQHPIFPPVPGAVPILPTALPSLLCGSVCPRYRLDPVRLTAAALSEGSEFRAGKVFIRSEVP